MQKSEFTKAAISALNDLKAYFKTHASHSISNNNPDLYNSCLKATLVKSYEFAVSIDSYNEEHMYFTLPVLRGICEDFIVEKFIFEKLNEDKEEVIMLLQSYENLKSSIVQWNYFEENRPQQILYYKDDFPSQLEEIKLKLKSLIKKKLPSVQLKPVLPSIRYMSTQTDMHKLYTYLYHATSTFVHFNPNNLLRMGWGDLPNITFSTSHFRLYYKDFAQFYSILLLSRICEWQYGNGYLPDFNSQNISALNNILNNASRYPELITFEEMNIGALSKLMFYKSPAQAKNNLSHS